MQICVASKGMDSELPVFAMVFLITLITRVYICCFDPEKGRMFCFLAVVTSSFHLYFRSSHHFHSK